MADNIGHRFVDTATKWRPHGGVIAGNQVCSPAAVLNKKEAGLSRPLFSPGQIRPGFED